MPSRTVIDREGREWLVWAVFPSTTVTRIAAAGVRPEFTAGWLTFETSTEKRRLAPIPHGWDTAPDAELLAMLARATKASRRTSVSSQSIAQL